MSTYSPGCKYTDSVVINVPPSVDGPYAASPEKFDSQVEVFPWGEVWIRQGGQEFAFDAVAVVRLRDLLNLAIADAVPA